ncbi:hypothetical protein ASZ90_010442 [hydrocarbon metagenome]|uniref:Uncharacterized protein n=1 Tax=hydrocarbon metagenome TaxID=938273 RepID=A0A0W8FFZ5_9ZZZZ
MQETGDGVKGDLASLIPFAVYETDGSVKNCDALPMRKGWQPHREKSIIMGLLRRRICR